ncbi:MAG: nucleoside phosphorylase, partial [Planctomycetota bacterium]|nr:nucleoside phosphorylase [Planctomycetota bacterium]
VARLFEKVKFERANREYVTFTGTYRGLPISVMATGIGCDNTEIAVIEILQLVRRPTLIRIGSSGGIGKGIKLGDLVISEGAVRLENTSTFFAPEGYPAVASFEVVLALVEAAESLGVEYHLGLTATAPGFYGAQGRTVPGLPAPRFPGLAKELERINVANLEMETSALLTLASLAGVRAGAICAVYAERRHNRFITSDVKDKAEMKCVLCGLGALEVLARMDRAKSAARSRWWRPSLQIPPAT